VFQGSNPCLSAKMQKAPHLRGFVFWAERVGATPP
jgi:hypothetical protein